MPKEELLDEVWEHRFATGSAITSRIKSARKVIGDNGPTADDQDDARGYRFVAALDEKLRAASLRRTLRRRSASGGRFCGGT